MMYNVIACFTGPFPVIGTKAERSGLPLIFPGVAQLVARVVWDHDAAGSNPVTRTIKCFALSAPVCELGHLPGGGGK